MGLENRPGLGGGGEADREEAERILQFGGVWGTLSQLWGALEEVLVAIRRQGLMLHLSWRRNGGSADRPDTELEEGERHEEL